MNLLAQQLEDAANFIRNRSGNFQPELGIILGSGMGVLAEEIQDSIKIPYHEIPGFPVSGVKGHAGQLVLGMLEGKSVVIMQGRIHYYEGHSQAKIAFPVRVMKLLGINTLLLTNAAGGVDDKYEAGDFMIIEDHINFTFSNPLMGANLDQFGPRFPDNSRTYDSGIIEKMEAAAINLQLKVHKGIYMFFSGPTYETPAEIKLARKMGASAVGMSTFPEALTGAHAGLKVGAISFIANRAAGTADQILSHAEVLEALELNREKFLGFLKEVIRKI